MKRPLGLVSAGHPPPAVVTPDGTVRFTPLATDPPLGVADLPFEVAELPLGVNAVLVLYTDGLLAAADRDTQAAMSRLASLLETHHGQPVSLFCDSLTSALLPADQHTSDDAALLVVQVHATAPEAVVSWPLSVEPRAAGLAREHVRDQLATWGLPDLAETTELLASELVSNVIRHAAGPIGLRLLRSRTLVCEVSDGSLTTPRIRRASWTDEGGRGLQLVAALSDRWGTRYMSDGKCIRTEQSLS